MPRRGTGRPSGRPVVMEGATELHIRVSAADRHRLKMAARRGHISVAALIRHLVHRGLSEDVPSSPATVTAPTIETRSELLRVTLTPSELDELRSLATKHGATMAEVTRSALRHYRLITPPERATKPQKPVPGRRRRDE